MTRKPSCKRNVTSHKHDNPRQKQDRIRSKVSPKRNHRFTNEIFGPTEHAKRLESLANAVVGITQVAVLAIHAIGQAYAQVSGISAKSGVKQIDRLLSNDNLILSSVLKQ
jgi:hypothetical protein